MNVLDLFSGIGGFSLGLERAGMRTVAFCEIDPFCRAVLAKHWPDVPIYDDARTLDADRLGRIDLICGGYPCQPFSQAGKRLGAEDDRHLWPEAHRLVAALRPAWCLFENVAGHIIMGLDGVLSDLESMEYAARAFVVPACAVDAKHRRDRVWIVANSYVADTPRLQQGRQEQRPKRERVGTGGESEPLANASSERLQSSIRPKLREVSNAPEASPRGESSRRTTAARRTGKSESRLGRMADGISRWLDEPDIPRVSKGIKNRTERLEALGNAVVPQVVEKIGRAILAAEEEMRERE